MLEDLKVLQIGSSPLPPLFRGPHSPGVRKHGQIISACYFRKLSIVDLSFSWCGFLFLSFFLSLFFFLSSFMDACLSLLYWSTCILSACVLSTCFSLVWIAFPRAGVRRQRPTQKSWNSLNNWQKFFRKCTKSHISFSLYFFLFPVSVTLCSPQHCLFQYLSSGYVKKRKATTMTVSLWYRKSSFCAPKSGCRTCS